MLTFAIVIVLICSATFLASRSSFFKGKQVRQGILMGIVAIIANTFSVDIYHLNVSVGLIDAPLMIAGFFFGPLAGVIAGFIAAGERALTPLWGVGKATWLVCSCATFMVSIYAVLLRKWIFDNECPPMIVAIIAAAFGEVLHLALIFLTGMNNLSLTFEVIFAAILPMTIGSGLAAGLSALAFFRWNGLRAFMSQASARSSFVMFGLCFGVLSYVCLNEAKKSADQTLLFLMDRYDAKIHDFIGFFLHRCAYNIALELRDSTPKTTENMQRIARGHSLDEASIVTSDEKIISSTHPEYLNFTGFNRKTVESREFFDLFNGREVVKQGFRPSLNPPYDRSQYLGISMPDKKAILEVGYTYRRMEEEFGKFFIPQLGSTPILDSGFFIITDGSGKIVEPVRYHDGVEGKTLQEIGFTENDLKHPARKPFFARVLGDWSRCGFVRQIGNYRIYEILPIRDVYDGALKTIFLSGIFLFVLSLIFRYSILRIIRSQKTIDALRLQNEKQQRDDMALARQIQSSELKTKNLISDVCNINVKLVSAKDVCGDFYEYYELPDGRIMIGIADVSGKGMPAAFVMMKVKIALKLHGFNTGNICEIFQRANQELCANNDAEMFVTGWGGFFDKNTGDVEFISAGHNPPLIVRSGGSVEWVRERGGLPLGVCDSAMYRSSKIHLNRGDQLFLYTDGVTEAMNPSKEIFGEKRLEQALLQSKKDTRHTLIEQLLGKLKKFANGAEQSDDITMLTLVVK